MRLIYILLAFLTIQLTACGKKSSARDGKSDASLKEIGLANMKKGLWCDGMPTYGGTNNVTGRADCNNGDGMIWAGLVYSVWPTQEIKNGIKNSIDADGRPFRSFEHRLGRDNENSFSRDMYLGFLSYCLKDKDKETCDKVLDYAVRNDYQLCPDSNDNACLMNPSMLYLTYAVWDENGWSLPNSAFKPNIAERAADDLSMLTTAKTSALSYRTHLLAVKIWLYAKTEGVTETRKQAAGELWKRQKDNLFYWYVAWLTGYAPDSDHGRISERVRAMGTTWEPSATHTGRRDWIWQQDVLSLENYGRAMGQDFGFLLCEIAQGC